jgi:SAM-dependent methyltransferase
MEERYEHDTLAAEDWHWWYRGRRRIVEDAVAALQLPPSADILDAGCGSGRNLAELRRFGRLTGLEPSPTSVQAARVRGIGTIVQSGIEAMPFEDASYDLTLCLDVIEHVDDDAVALRELRRVVRPGGFLIVTVPAYPRLWSRHDELNQHRRRYTRRVLLERATAVGWEPRRTTHFNALLLPAAAAVRLLERTRSGDRAGSSELERTPRALNVVLEQALRSEAALLRTGRRIPAGLSLMGVFRTP